MISFGSSRPRLVMIFCIVSVKFRLVLNLPWRSRKTLAFFDVRVSRSSDNTLWTNIYQKPTHTNRYSQFDSYHLIHQKLALARSLHNRLETHVSNHDDRSLQCNLTKKALTLNGFPLRHCSYQRI